MIPQLQSVIIAGSIVFGAAAIDANTSITVGCAVSIIGFSIASSHWATKKWDAFLARQKTNGEKLDAIAKKFGEYDQRFESQDRKMAELSKKHDDLALLVKFDLDRLRAELINGRPPSPENFRPAILLVDDDARDRDLFKRSLGRIYFIEEAETLGEAITKAKAVKYDCVVIDLYLTDSSPNETVERFMKEHPTAVCIAFSGTQSQEHINQATKAGADSFISKGHITDAGYMSRQIQLAMSRKKIE